jgi:hypothetical protein
MTYTPSATLTLTPSQTFTPSATATASATATLTPIPTGTFTEVPPPTAQPSAIPVVLGDAPSDFSPSTAAVAAGNYAMQITDLRGLDSIGDLRPQSGSRFLVMDVLLFNYGDGDQTFFDTDFLVDTAAASGIIPSTGAMSKLKSVDPHYIGLDYPGRNVVLAARFRVPAKGYRNTFLVYEVPRDTWALTVEFGPAGIQPRSTLGLWLNAQPTGDILFARSSLNGQNQYAVTWDVVNTEVQRQIDLENEVVDNCFGTGTLERVRILDRSVPAQVLTGNEALAAASPTTPGSTDWSRIPFPPAFVVGQVESQYGMTMGDPLSYRASETLRAAPGTKTNYQIVWYRVSTYGEARVEVGGGRYAIPYLLDTKLRATVISLPPSACGTRTPNS